MGRICTFQNRNAIRYSLENIFIFGPSQMMQADRQAGRFISIILIYFPPVSVEAHFEFKIFLVHKTLSRCQLSRHYCWKTFKSFLDMKSWNMWINIFRKYKSHSHSSFCHSLLTVYHNRNTNDKIDLKLERKICTCWVQFQWAAECPIPDLVPGPKDQEVISITQIKYFIQFDGFNPKIERIT